MGITESWIRDRLEGGFSREDLASILRCDERESGIVFAAAREVRKRHFGDRAFIRAVIEFANTCRCSCLYCGMRADNSEILRFTLTREEIVDTAALALDSGIRTFFLQAAENTEYDAGWLEDVIGRIHSMGMGVLLCVGIHSEDDLELWYRAGARKFILKHETADPELFARMKPGHTLEERVRWLRTIRGHGYHIGSGPLLGLPGQTVDTLVDDLFLLRDLCVEMSSVSVFLPARGTPLEDHPVGDPELGLRFIAAMRLFLGDTLIPATSTFEKLMEGGQLRCFMAGANVITVNMTPRRLRDDYELYTDRYYVGLQHARTTIRDAGLTETTEMELLSGIGDHTPRTT
jgi:biotin synthase